MQWSSVRSKLLQVLNDHSFQIVLTKPPGELDEKPDPGMLGRNAIRRLVDDDEDDLALGMVWMDSAIGVLLDLLEKNDILDNTVFVVCNRCSLSSLADCHAPGYCRSWSRR